MPEKPEQYYRVDIRRYPSLSSEAESELFSAYRTRKTAKRREAIVRQYLYWAAELACRYCGPRMSKSDAISAANFGLMRAIDRFDPAAGKRFVTYSYFLIRREVLYALRDSYVVNPEPGVKAARRQLAKTDRTAEDVETFKTARRCVFDNVCAPAPIAGPKGNLPTDEREELLGDDMRDSVQEASLLDALRKSLPGLPKELRRVVELKYFGLRPMSFVEIGEKLKHSPDHVRWLHSRALKSLQKLLRPVRKEL